MCDAARLSVRVRGGLSNQRECIVNAGIAAHALGLPLVLPRLDLIGRGNEQFALGTLEKGRTDMFQVRPCERASARAPHCWPRLRRIRLGRRRYARRAGSPFSTFIFLPSEV